MTPFEFIVICQQVIGGNGREFEIAYEWDGERFTTQRQAIAHGFKIRGSDDFNIGTLKEGELVSFAWMDRRQPGADLPHIQSQIGLP